jgi:hypothetical protein
MEAALHNVTRIPVPVALAQARLSRRDHGHRATCLNLALTIMAQHNPPLRGPARVYDLATERTRRQGAA